MGRLLSVVIAVGVAYVADARAHTFQDVPVDPSFAAILKRLYVDASRNPVMINVDKFSCTSLNDNSSVSVIIAPVNVDVNLLKCWVSGDHYALDASASWVYKSSDVLRCGTSMSRKMAIDHSGTYMLYVANCGGSRATFTIQISGDVNAHERGWPFVFFIFLMFHVCLCAAWAAHRHNQEESAIDTVTKEIFHACVAAVVSHCVGFVSHFVSEPSPHIEAVHIVLWSATLSLTMVALITVSGVGCSAPGPWCRNAYFALFFLVILAGLTDNGTQFDKYGDPPRDRNSKAEWATTSWGIAGCFLVFGFICVRLLARSFRCLQLPEQQKIVAVLRKMTVVIAVYTGLGVVSATCIAYDVPSNESNSWGFHLVAGCAVTELTQSFGLSVTILMLWKANLHIEHGTCYNDLEALPCDDDEKAIIHHTSSQDAKTDAHEQDACVVYGK